MNARKRVAALALCGSCALAPLARAQDAQLEKLVAPIALYPDVLVAQTLVAATHPAELARAERWLEREAFADAAQTAQAVDGERWDPEIKALALVPGVLEALNRNYAWTVALGQAYAEDPREVLRAVQFVRQKARARGALASSTTQLVVNDGDTIVIQPADARRAYVPGGRRYDIGVFERFAWGWHSWQLDWRHARVMFQDAPYREGGVTPPAPSARLADVMVSETSLDADDTRAAQERGATLITDWL